MSRSPLSSVWFWLRQEHFSVRDRYFSHEWVRAKRSGDIRVTFIRHTVKCSLSACPAYTPLLYQCIESLILNIYSSLLKCQILHMELDVLYVVYKKSLSVGALRCGECILNNSWQFKPCINRQGIWFVFSFNIYLHRCRLVMGKNTTKSKWMQYSYTAACQKVRFFQLAAMMMKKREDDVLRAS